MNTHISAPAIQPAPVFLPLRRPKRGAREAQSSQHGSVPPAHFAFAFHIFPGYLPPFHHIPSKNPRNSAHSTKNFLLNPAPWNKFLLVNEAVFTQAKDFHRTLGRASEVVKMELVGTLRAL
jgi:hypothetical protein